MRKQQPSVAHKSFFLSHRSYAPTKFSEPPDHSRKPLEKENCNTGSSNTFHRAYDDSALSPEQIAWKRLVLSQPDDIVSAVPLLCNTGHSLFSSCLSPLRFFSLISNSNNARLPPHVTINLYFLSSAIDLIFLLIPSLQSDNSNNLYST